MTKTETEEAGKALELVAPTDVAIQSIRAQGSAAVAFERERNALARTIEGVKFGSVAGTSLSVQTRTMLAQFCVVTKANPMVHVDILGGKPYLNAAYWFELMVGHPYYVSHSTLSITEESEQGYRTLAAECREAYEGMRESSPEEAAVQLSSALAFERTARECVEARALWTPRKSATHVIQTTIRRYMNQAPLEAIKRGELTMEEAEKWMIDVKECNWAGAAPKGDPVGNDEPEKTARTRSVRRTAVRAFSAWMRQYEEQITKAEEALEAEWELVSSESTALPTTGAQAVSGTGEPEAANVEGAKSLPVRGAEAGEDGEIVQEEKKPEPEPEPEPEWDKRDTHKRLFATLKDCGISDKQRKKWAKKNDLPESTSEWDKEMYERALGILVDPLKAKVAEGCNTLGLDVNDLALQVIGKDGPDFAKDYLALISALEIRLEAAGDENDDDAGL